MYNPRTVSDLVSDKNRLLNSVQAYTASGAAQLKYLKNCALSDKSTKLGRYVDQYITNISGYSAITDLAPDGRGSHFTKWPLMGDIFVQNHWWGVKQPNLQYNQSNNVKI